MVTLVTIAKQETNMLHLVKHIRRALPPAENVCFTHVRGNHFGLGVLFSGPQKIERQAAEELTSSNRFFSAGYDVFIVALLHHISRSVLGSPGFA